MKKLLALILCVMMFVAVIPTSAFAVSIPTAYVPTTSGTFYPKWANKTAAQKAVDAATDNIQALYQTLAADKGVFAVVSAIDGVVTGISDQIWKDVDEVKLGSALQKKLGTNRTVTGDDMNDLTKFYLRTVIGNEIMNYMNGHAGAYATHSFVKDANGNVIGTRTKIDPVKYMDAFATAASKAVSSEKAVKNIQAIVLSLAAGAAYDDFIDDLDDLREEIALWNDGDGAAVWATYFADMNSDDWTSDGTDAQNVLPYVDGGDLYMDPFALIEPDRHLDTSKYFDVYAPTRVIVVAS
jgi:hypothetical protein